MDSIEQTEPGYYDEEGHFHACPEWRESVTQDQEPEPDHVGEHLGEHLGEHVGEQVGEQVEEAITE